MHCSRGKAHLMLKLSAACVRWTMTMPSTSVNPSRLDGALAYRSWFSSRTFLLLAICMKLAAALPLSLPSSASTTGVMLVLMKSAQRQGEVQCTAKVLALMHRRNFVKARALETFAKVLVVTAVSA
jgi:hypothetical protein